MTTTTALEAPKQKPRDMARIRRRVVPGVVIFGTSLALERWGWGVPFFIRHWAEDVVDVFGLAGLTAWVLLPLYHRKKPHDA